MSKTRLAVMVMVVVLGFAVSVQAAPIWEFKFNDAGDTTTTAENTGTDGTSPALTMWDGNGYHHAANMIGPDGSGVSGQSGDNALDFSALPTHGGKIYSYSPPGTNIPNGQIGAVAGMTTMTHSYWVKLDSAIEPTSSYATNGVLGHLDTNYGNGFSWFFGQSGDTTTNNIKYAIDGSSGTFNINSYMTHDDNGKWFFFALTYDGNLTSSNVNLFIGSETDNMQLVGTQSANQGALNMPGLAFSCHSALNSTGGIDGWGDNYRIDGTVLDIDTLEARRLADLGTGGEIPEPGTLLLLGTGALGAIGYIRRKRMR